MEFAFKADDVQCILIEDACGYIVETCMKHKPTITVN